MSQDDLPLQLDAGQVAGPRTIRAIRQWMRRRCLLPAADGCITWDQCSDGIRPVCNFQVPAGGPIVETGYPFKPTKTNDDDGNALLNIQHGWIKPLGLSTSCGGNTQYTNQPTFEGSDWPTDGDATMPLPATGIYDILACIEIKAGTLDVETSAAERCLCACIRGVDVIVRDVTALPTSTPWKCGVDDPDDEANNVAAVDGEIYTCIGKIDIVNETDECSVKILNSGTESNLFINCCNGKIDLIGDGRAA